MAVSSIFKPLFYAFGKVGGHVRSFVVERIMQANNAMYEALFDDTAPGASGQTIHGHNHADSGGGPLIRGLCFGWDNGRAGVFTNEFTNGVVAYWAIEISVQYRVSEHLDNDGLMEGYLFYSAKNADVEMIVRETLSGKSLQKASYKLPQTYRSGENEKGQWLKIQVPLGEGETNGLVVQFDVSSNEDEYPPGFKIHSMNWNEVPGVSYRFKGVKI